MMIMSNLGLIIIFNLRRHCGTAVRSGVTQFAAHLPMLPFYYVRSIVLAYS
jgi:hypothetical protein